MAKPLKIVRTIRRTPVVAALLSLVLASATAAPSAPAPRQPDSIVDNETVYVVADASGVPQTTVVVDWLQVQGSGSLQIIDPAAGADSIESLSDGFTPSKSGDAVFATVQQEGYGDYFYRAETSDPLPFDVRVVYFLDGQETSPGDLAGKSGRLRIEITIVNHLERLGVVEYENADGRIESSEATYTVPILCIPQLEIDGTRMTDIVPPEGAQLAIAGSTRTYAIPMVPTPEETVAIEMTARDIELAPMIVSGFPGMPASPDFSVVDSFVELRDGLTQLGKLSEGHLALVEGVSKGMSAYDLSSATGVADGLGQLQGALAQMQAGADGLSQLSAGQIQYVDGVITGIGSSTGGLIALLDGQIAFAESMRAGSASVLAETSGYAAEYGAHSTDATSQAAAADFSSLAVSLGGQHAMLGMLIDGGDPDGAGPAPYMPGLKATRASLVAIGDSLGTLRDGGDPDGAGPAPYMPGFVATKDGVADLASGLAQATAGLADSSADLSQLSSLPSMMGDLKSVLVTLAEGGRLQGRNLPGIDTTVDALSEVSGGLGDGADEMREGEAITEVMKIAAKGYTSFLGMPEGATGHLSFLYKVDGVSK